MKLRVYSDMHNEFRRGAEWYPSELDGDADTVLVLAGDMDIGKHLTKFVDAVAPRFKAVVYILGNHELWGSNIDKLDKFVSEAPNAHFLNNSTVTIDGVEFIGTTLWTDMNRGNPLDMLNAPAVMQPDFKKIKVGESYSRFTAERWIIENKIARKFLEGTIDVDKDQILVVHHGPAFACAEGNPMSGNSNDVYYYNNGLEEIIIDVDLCIFGHTHHRFDKTWGNMRIYSNPGGYYIPGQPGLLVAEFDETGRVDYERR